MTSNAIDPIKNYGPIESKFNYPQQPTSLAEASVSSFFSSSGSSPISSSSSPLSSNVIPPFSLNQQASWLSDSPPPPKIENFADRPRSKSESSIKKSKQGGRKRSIIFEEEEAELQRKEFLERNRVAASKCRQKKKKWMKDLETNYSKLFTQNERLRSMIMVYQDEANSLKSELLARDGLCSCANMRAYIQQRNTITTMNPKESLAHENDAAIDNTAPPLLPSVSPPTSDNGMLPDKPLPSFTLSNPRYLKE
ncbi:hypothetical protein BCR42DRAFT_392130 [Absidia repens]|uniref:BZIP domain-containing protein n=1 Tax=Absidia repens TaxID=90262 RepID=A0A1X2IKN0_9FUNG|nr:hypothetical protein BCR42DRAFT_392130 [Absidia repens]